MQRDGDEIFDRAAQLFSLLSAPIRLRILNEICKGEINSSQLLARIDVSQPNISQHLGLMYRAGILFKRHAGNQVFYRIENGPLTEICKSICVDISGETGTKH
jgi:DNA-binding transcriptional ArsR family regulator